MKTMFFFVCCIGLMNGSLLGVIKNEFNHHERKKRLAFLGRKLLNECDFENATRLQSLYLYRQSVHQILPRTRAFRCLPGTTNSGRGNKSSQKNNRYADICGAVYGELFNI